MKFSLVSGQRQLAQPGLSGTCPNCGRTTHAKCGELKAWHWAHRTMRDCDSWWEKETEWHLDWKDQFPPDWQEIVHHAEDGERHIADVKTPDGWVLEFQHSIIRPEERRSREAFYQALIWVVDGKKRQRDEAKFLSAWANGEALHPISSKRRINLPKSALLRDWTGSTAHVFFDFGDKTLWWLFPASDDMRAYVFQVSRDEFLRAQREINVHGESKFDSLVQNFTAFIANYELPPPVLQTRNLKVNFPPPNHTSIIQRRFRL